MTGYTAELVEKDMTFEQWALTCARAFGALIEMRDDALDAAIPEKFEPSRHHVEKKQAAVAKMAELGALNVSERLRYGQNRRKATLKGLCDSLEETRKTVAKLHLMLAHANRWEPPTIEHQGLKDFMVQQLTDSIEHSGSDYLVRRIAEVEASEPIEFFNSDLEQAEKDIEYHARSYAEECERVATRNQWVADLRASLK